MALQSSGQISLNDIHVELGASSGSQVSINDSDVRGLIDKGSGAQMSFSEWYGASNAIDLTSAGTVNGQNQRKQISASSFVSSGGTLVIPSSLWVWSDSISTAALTVDIPCTIENYGKIIGKGGRGGDRNNANVENGGRAIYITSSGVTIKNMSGGYIAGGGGGGAGGQYNGAGGGAGGGHSGYNNPSDPNFQGGDGGALNGTGTRAYYSGYSIDPQVGYGGGAGGGGGAVLSTGGGGGGRILPGVGGAGGQGTSGPSYDSPGGDGGSAGNAGQNGFGSRGAGGGGGWGANGGNAGGESSGRGSGGAAIGKTTSYSLTNSGTIYGST